MRRQPPAAVLTQAIHDGVEQMNVGRRQQLLSSSNVPA
jgi:hypothetical protein